MALRMRLSVCFLTFALLAVWMAPSQLRGQAISGDLSGTILDPSGAGVPNAKVEVVNTATGITASATTNASGEYRFSNLAPGTYNVNVTAAAFAAGSLRNVRVNL